MKAYETTKTHIAHLLMGMGMCMDVGVDTTMHLLVNMKAAQLPARRWRHRARENKGKPHEPPSC